MTVIGQAKRYNPDNFVSETELRKFVGGAIYKASTLKSTISSLGVIAPISYAFWTTSNFHPDAITYARNMGLWYLNGLALAQLANRMDIDKV